jgi:hypothetical protein
MHQFAVGLICTLAGAIAGILFANFWGEKREVEAYDHGYRRGHSVGYDIAVEQQREKDSDRAKKAAQTRRSKAHAS